MKRRLIAATAFWPVLLLTVLAAVVSYGATLLAAADMRAASGATGALAWLVLSPLAFRLSAVALIGPGLFVALRYARGRDSSVLLAPSALLLAWVLVTACAVYASYSYSGQTRLLG